MTNQLEGFADYSFIRSLGQGNFGEFFLATPPPRLNLNLEAVAVKVLSGTTSDNAYERAKKEWQMFASLRSEYLVTMFDAGRVGDTSFYSTEYFPLGSLGSALKPLSRAETLRAMAHAARGAAALHAAGIAHGDIKPSNIMLHESGAKLSDLGVARLLSPGMTMSGIGSIGSVEYLDPLVVMGERTGLPSDVWSLGVTLHRVLTGLGVFGELPDAGLLAIRKVLTTKPVLDRSLREPERVLIEACLDSDPTRRPSALSLAESLEAIG